MNKKKFKIDWSNTMNKIKEQAAKKGNSYKDERVYYPQFNDNGTAQAIIRFLPSPDTDIPFVSYFTHSIKGPGGWYIEDCPTTLKKECPVCKANSAIWNSDPDTARSRKRKQNYMSNILVVKDPANPENEGKVFLYRYGKKVHDKIMEKIQPGEESIDEPVMIFDYYDGADFKLIIKKIQVGAVKMPNYDSCNFDTPAPVGTDTEIEKINEQLYPLTEFVSEGANHFNKTYAELENKFNRVVGIQSNSTPAPSPEKQPEPEVAATDEKPKKVDEDNVFDGNDEEFFNELQKDEE